MPMNRLQNPVRSQSGYALSAALRVILLLVVVGEVVYLARQHRVRFDFTSDKEYTLTDSTREVLKGLEDRLLIEAYFTDDDKLPLVARPYRSALTSFLDEYQQMSDGRIVLRYYDPQEDEAIKQKAERLGMQPQQLPNVSRDESFSVQMVWQGLRLRYGSDKQKVIPFMGFAEVPFQYEAALTPVVKDLTVKTKPKVGFLAFGTEGQQMSPYMQQQQQSEGPKRFDRVKEAVKGRFDVVDLDLSEGKLVPDDVKTVVLIRPKNLTDRQKYALDQFVMKGGKLLCFVDTNEYEIGQRRSFMGRDIQFDASDAKLKFVDQLGHYGAKVENKVVGDFVQGAQEPFVLVAQSYGGFPQIVPLQYPYFFHALDRDWSEAAEAVAENFGGANGGTAELVENYRKTFKPGIAKDHVVLGAIAARNGQGPGMYWPCPVGLTDELPQGVEGRVLMRTSPLAIVEPPPPALDPMGTDRDPNVRLRNARTFANKLVQRLHSDPRQQVPLMVSLSGKFRSFFAGKDIPPAKPPQVAQAPSVAGIDPLDAPLGTVTPTTEVATPPADAGTTPKEASGDGAKAGAPKDAEPKALEPKGNEQSGDDKGGEAKPEPGKQAEQPDKTEPPKGDDKGGPRAVLDAWMQEPATTGQDPEQPHAQQPADQPAAADREAAGAQGGEPKQEPAKPELMGPQMPPAAAAPEAPKDPEPIFEGAEAMVVVVGDSDMIRDDLVSMEYDRSGGPISQLGATFFVSMLDWLSEDQDLLALRTKQPMDRRLSFAAAGPFGAAPTNPDELEQRAEWMRAVNIGGPVVALLAIGIVVWLRRRAQKQSFIAAVES